jgi:uncharacterized membrane protein
MRDETDPGRVSAFSDAVFAVLITILVLDLRPPAIPTYAAMLELWPRWLSYAVSYLFIAIVWANHHYLLRYARRATTGLVWFNFAHLFSISLLPVATTWMATSRLAPQPVSFYAVVFFLVNATYLALIWELIDKSAVAETQPAHRRVLHWRGLATLCLFGSAALVALWRPIIGLAICICCLALYLKPDPALRRQRLAADPSLKGGSRPRSPPGVGRR